MYDVASIYFARALAYRCRTRNASQADVFFVPAYNTEQTQHPSSFCAEPRGAANHQAALIDRLRQQAGDAFMANGGLDHFFVNPRPGAGYYESHPLCELDLHSPRFGAAARLSVEQRPPAEDMPPRGPFLYVASPIMISVPYPSWVQLPSMRAARSARRAPWRSAHPRPVRIAAAFGTGVGGATSVSELRRRLRDLCVSRAVERAGACVYLPPPTRSRGGGPSTWSTGSSGGFNSDAAALYWNASFCLMPGGDSVTRKAALDAILLGCIPVFFHLGQLLQWDWHWRDWREAASVRFEHLRVIDNSTDPIASLMAMPNSKVAALRAALAANAHKLHYARVEGDAEDTKDAEGDMNADGGGGGDGDGDGGDGGDAFEITLRGVRARAATRSLLATEGKAEGVLEQQRVALTQADVALRAFARLNTSVGAREGICRSSTGAFDAHSCKDNASAPWLPPRPLIRVVHGLRHCVELCDRCAKCHALSYSLMLRLCTWHYRCDPDEPRHLDRAWELWTYRSWRVNASTRESVHELLNSSVAEWY